MERPDPGIKAVLKSPDENQLLLVISTPCGDDNKKAEREFLAGMRDSLESQGLKVKQEGDKIIGGTSFQTFRVDMGESGEMEVYLSNDGRTVFAVQLMGNPIGAEARAALESFRPLGDNGGGVGKGWQPDKDSEAYKLGALIGRVGIIVLIVTAVGVGVVSVIKKRRQS